MTPPIQRPETAIIKVLSVVIMIHFFITYLGVDGGWVILGYFPAILLAWALEKTHDCIRYRRYDNYYVDRFTGQVWDRYYSAPNPWDAGVVWLRTSITESELIIQKKKESKLG